MPAARKQAEQGGVPGAQEFVAFRAPERLPAKACPDLIRGGNRFTSRKPAKSGIWSPVSIRSKRKRLQGVIGHALKFMCVPILQAPEALLALSFRLDLANHRR